MASREREIFAKNLRFTIEKSHLTQAQIAAQIGVSRGTMSDYVHQKAYPRPAVMAKLCTALGVSQYDLTTDFYQDEDRFIPNRELLNLAKEIYENPDARALYTQLKELEPDEIQAFRTLISKCAGK